MEYKDKDRLKTKIRMEGIQGEGYGLNTDRYKTKLRMKGMQLYKGWTEYRNR